MLCKEETKEAGDALATMSLAFIKGLTHRGTFARHLVKLIDQIATELVDQEVCLDENKAVELACQIATSLKAHKG